MTRYSKWFTVGVALVALAALASCETRPTGFDPDPNRPEGVTAANARLISYRDHGLRVMVRDYASTNIDSVVLSAQALPGPTTMPLLLLLDGTAANSFEMYRRDDAGRFERTADYTLQSVFKYVDVGYEEFFTPDPSPSGYNPSSYLARGLSDGIATHASPLTNEGQLTQTNLIPIKYNGELFPLDSLFTVSWVGVPGAVGYWIHIYVKPIAGFERLVSSFPAPISYLTTSDLLIAYREGNNPGGSVQFRLGATDMLTLRHTAPLLGPEYLVRISGVDATGQVIAQTPGDLDSIGVSADLAFLLPPTFRIEKSKLFFSLGGTKVARRSLTRGPANTTSDASAAEPSAASVQLGRQQHVMRLGFPYVTPASGSSAERRVWRR